MKASIDLGENVTNLLEKLAVQIGTTTDKVFPWYVKQQVIEGWCWLTISGGVFLVGLIIALSCIRPSLNKKDPEPYITVIIIAAMASVVGLLFFLFGMGGAVTQITNPEYHALRALTSDLSKLVK